MLIYGRRVVGYWTGTTLFNGCCQMTNSLDCNWSASLLLFLLHTFLVFTIANNFFHAITFFFRLNQTGSCIPFKSPQNNRKSFKKSQWRIWRINTFSIWEIHNLTIAPGECEENVLMATFVVGFRTFNLERVMKKIPKQIFLSLHTYLVFRNSKDDLT